MGVSLLPSGCGSESAELAPMPAEEEEPRRVLEAAVSFRARITGTPAIGSVEDEGASWLGPSVATGFSMAGSGWKPTFQRVPPSTLRADVELPELSSGTVRVVDQRTGTGVRFTMRGATSARVAVVDGYAVYPGGHAAGADVIHRATPEGTEDFLLFSERPTVEEVVYDIGLDGVVAGLRLVSNTLEMLDAAGVPRLRLAPPRFIDARGTVAGAKIALEGCDADTRPAPPWGRVVTPPGASACAVRITWAAEAYPALVDPGWTTTASMAQPRFSHTASLLQSGLVLVAGGSVSGVSNLASAELFDPTTQTWAATGDMSVAANSRRAVMLASGKVLACGGGWPVIAECDIYDPMSGVWVSASSMSTPRVYHALTMLADGRVLVSGAATTAATEIYDPALSSWIPSAPMNEARYSHAAALLADGRVLVAAGLGTSSNGLTSCELYDPSSNAWVFAAALNTNRENQTAFRLPSGKVLVAGGNTNFTNVYDPVVNAWSGNGGCCPLPQNFSALTRLANGNVILTGGRPNGGNATWPLVSIYDFVQDAWASATDMGTPREFHTATTLPSGDVLVAGGMAKFVGGGVAYHASAEIYDGQPGLFANGDACSNSSDCASASCVDGVCCDLPCAGPCLACSSALKGGGVDGVCGPVPQGTDPKSGCDDQGAASCGDDGTCGGAGLCRKYLAGTVCSPASCDAGQQLAASSCDGAGTCNPGASSSCGTYACSGSTCGVTCTTELECAPGSFCSAPACVPKNGIGAACSSAGECLSGFCADGVCCGSVCTGPCLACSSALKGGGVDGVCGPVPQGTDPKSGCDDQGAASCGDDGTCGGAGLCRKYLAGTVCSPASCDAGQQLAASSCDGAGTCNPGASSSCGTYACSGSTCGVTCTTELECAPGSFCSASACVPENGIGAACSSAGECLSGFCADGVCCESACAGTCEACSAAKKGSGSDGACGAIANGTDPDDDCVPEAPATCGGDGECDGAGACRKYAAGTSCGGPTCLGTELHTSACDQAGGCIDTVTTCEPFVCADSSSCGAACSGDNDCADGFGCDISVGNCILVWGPGGTGSGSSAAGGPLPSAGGSASSSGCAIHGAVGAGVSWAWLLFAATGLLVESRSVQVRRPPGPGGSIRKCRWHARRSRASLRRAAE